MSDLSIALFLIGGLCISAMMILVVLIAYKHGKEDGKELAKAQRTQSDAFGRRRFTN